MPTARSAFLLRRYRRGKHVINRREYAQSFTKFKSLIASPETLADGSTLTLLAGVRLAVSCSVAVTAGNLHVVTGDGRTIKTPNLAAGQIFFLPFLERANTVKIVNLGTGTSSFYVLDEWNRAKKITNAIVNLLTTQDLSALFWGKTGYTVTGTDQVNEVASNSVHTLASNGGSVLTRAAAIATYHVSGKFKPVGAIQYLNVGLFSSGFGAGATVYADLSAGTTNSSSAYGGWSIANVVVGPADGSGYIPVSFDATTDAVTTDLIYDLQGNIPEGTFTFLGDITKGFKTLNLSVVKTA